MIKNNFNQTRRKFLAMSGAVAVLPTATWAQRISKEQATLRIDLAGRQRMLSQRMAKNVAMIRLGASPTEMLAQLETAYSDFENTLTGFQTGEGTSGITKEQNVSVKFAVDDARDKWNQFSLHVENVTTDGTVSDVALDYVIANNMELLGLSNDIVQALVRSYSDSGELDAALAITIDISGRQRMLTQKMTKDAALIGLGHETDTNIQDFNETLDLFIKSLTALREGGAGFITLASPNAATTAALDVVAGNLESTLPVAEQIRQGNADAAIVADFAQLTESLLEASHQSILSFEAQAQQS